MGSVSMAIAKAAQLHGAELHTEKVNRSLGGGGGGGGGGGSPPQSSTFFCTPLLYPPSSLPPFHPSFTQFLPSFSSTTPLFILTSCSMQPVQQIIVKNNVVEGVLLQDGTVVRAKTVLSNATPKVTFFDLLSDVRETPPHYVVLTSSHTRPLSLMISKDNWQTLITVLQ